MRAWWLLLSIETSSLEPYFLESYLIVEDGEDCALCDLAGHIWTRSGTNPELTHPENTRKKGV